MKTNAQQVNEYTVEIARLELERKELKCSIIGLVNLKSVWQIDTIIFLGAQITGLDAKIGTLSAMRAVYAKEPADADSLLTVPF